MQTYTAMFVFLSNLVCFTIILFLHIYACFSSPWKFSIWGFFLKVNKYAIIYVYLCNIMRGLFSIYLPVFDLIWIYFLFIFTFYKYHGEIICEILGNFGNEGGKQFSCHYIPHISYFFTIKFHIFTTHIPHFHHQIHHLTRIYRTSYIEYRQIPTIPHISPRISTLIHVRVSNIYKIMANTHNIMIINNLHVFKLILKIILCVRPKMERY